MLIQEYLEMDVCGVPLIINSVWPYCKNIFVIHFVIFFHHYLRLASVEALSWILFFVFSYMLTYGLNKRPQITQTTSEAVQLLS